MILTRPKSWDEILTALAEWKLKSVAVVGCGSCSAQCGTGGTEGVTKIVEELLRKGFSIPISLVIEEPCDRRLVDQELKRIGKITTAIEGYVVASCGIGAQTIAEITQKPVIITTDTIMMTQTERLGIYHEKCQACGQCVLNYTAGICPITLCAKSLLNGPCGGVKDGKCEVGHGDRPCAWYEIYEKLKNSGHLTAFMKIHAPLDWSRTILNHSLDIRKEMKTIYACNHE